MNSDGPRPDGTPQAAFDRAYSAHHQALHAYFLGHTGDPEAALDLLQEAFLRVWRNVHALQAVRPGEERFWLFAVGRSVLTDYYRRRATRQSLEQSPGHEAGRSAPSWGDPRTQLLQKEELTLLDRAIRQLPEKLRTVLLMQVLGDLTSAQIGAALGRPAGTVRYQIALARRRLAAELELAQAGAGREEEEREATSASRRF